MALTRFVPRSSRTVRAALAALPVVVFVGAVQQPASTENLSSRKLGELRILNSVIGEWRGVGQPQRGSRRGAWTEKTESEWEFSQSRPSVTIRTRDGLQYSMLKLTLSEKPNEIRMEQRLKEQLRVYTGRVPAKWPGTMTLVSEPDDGGDVWQCTLQQLSDIRFTLLFEKKGTPTGRFRRVAGIGYTREGEKLAEVGGGQRKCIVTGGLGTIPVTHDGKTYYVCCQGCVQAFNDAPDEIIAAYKESLKDSSSP